MYEYRKLTPEQKTELVRQRLVRGFPPHSPPHLNQNDAIYLLTGACYNHVHHLVASQRRQWVLDRFFELFIEYGMAVHAWVVLPNHYHFLIHVTDFKALSEIFRLVHGTSSHDWNIEDHKRGRKVWYRFSDRAMRSERHYNTTLNYIHYNPVKHQWAKSPYDWQESSIHWYLEEFGRDRLRQLWTTYPVRDYGKGWDDYSSISDTSGAEAPTTNSGAEAPTTNSGAEAPTTSD